MSRAEISILSWLPNEILSTVMKGIADTSPPDLASLCRTSRLINSLATPLLYRSIVLANAPQIEYFVRTMNDSSGSSPPLCRYVKRLSISDAWSITTPDPGLKLSPRAYETISSVLPKFSAHLEYLDLLLLLDRGGALEFTETLFQDAYFPSLTFFRYIIQPQLLPLLSSFLNRHPTITDLSPIQVTDTLEPLPLYPILLPNLETYDGAVPLIPSFNLDSGSISRVTLRWRRGDTDIERPLAHLGSTAAPDTFVGAFGSDTFEHSTVLESVGTHLPDVKTLKLQRTGSTARVSREETLQIATQLKKFTSLSELEVLNADARVQQNPDADREALLAWGEACQTLSAITLNGREWKLVLGEWVALQESVAR
ncbi:hypothetical protein B0H13DRAFT_884850 [Mycena leptocephala]|nr:hypothetical protein B0H13DRAFT_884850 [Mycena leptocephala]